MPEISETTAGFFAANEFWSAVVGALGAFVAILIAQALSNRSAARDNLRDRRLDSAGEIISALHELNRRLTNVAYVSDSRSRDPTDPEWVAYHQSAVRWNTAISTGLAYLSKADAARLLDLDREVDRLLDLAMFRSDWERGSFRTERLSLGRDALTFINAVRREAGEEDLELVSIWSWDDGQIEEPLSSGHQTTTHD